MRVRIGYDIELEFPQPAVMVLMLCVHPDQAGDLESSDAILLNPPAPTRLYLDCFNNICLRVQAPAGRLTLRTDAIIRRDDAPEPWPIDRPVTAVEVLPDAVLQFLMPSRYCEVDKINDFAWQTFGSFAPGWPRLKAILDWVKTNIEFGYQHARATRTAAETLEERVGVCRDMNHLALTLCRCLNIPARYATGYLGDIGVPACPSPMDFSAYFEVYMDDRWWAMDARHNQQRIARVLQARGRDAADVALITSFGPHKLMRFNVVTDEIKS